MIDRLGRLIGRHSGRVLVAATAFFILAGVAGGPVAGRLTAHDSDFQDPSAPSVRAAGLIERASGQAAELGVVALVRGPGDARTDRRARGKAVRVARLLAAAPGAVRVLDYPSTRIADLVSSDHRTSVVLAAFHGQDEAKAAVDRLRRRLAGHGVSFGGRDLAFAELNERTTSDLTHAELLAFPILLLLSFWVFRGLIAALLPPLVGLAAILASLLGLRLANDASPVSIFALNLVTGMGLGLAIDYSLFVVSRYREELAVSPDPAAAIRRTLQTAGRTVLYSSLTVAGALAALLVFPLRFLSSMGIGGTLVALCAGAVSLTVLPAVLVLLGPRINSLAPAALQRSRARSDLATEQGAWFRLGRAVMRRPGAVAVVVTAVLALAALPSLRLGLTPASASALPASSETRRVSESLARDFPSDGSQRITLVVQAPRTAAADVRGLARRGRRSSRGRPARRHHRPSASSVGGRASGRSTCSPAGSRSRPPTSGSCAPCGGFRSRPSAARRRPSSTRRRRSPRTCRWPWGSSRPSPSACSS